MIHSDTYIHGSMSISRSLEHQPFVDDLPIGYRHKFHGYATEPEGVSHPKPAYISWEPQRFL